MKQHPSRRQVIGALSASALAGLAPTAWAQSSNFPSKPVKIIMPWAAGGGGEVSQRFTKDSKHFTLHPAGPDRTSASG